MARKTFHLRPANHAMSVENPSLYSSGSTSPAILNCRFEQNSLKKRWGYSLDRSPLSKVYEIVLFHKSDGTRYTLYLTATDLILKEAAGTFSYKTKDYTTGTIANIVTTAVTGSTTGWSGNVAAGDGFIVDSDHTATSEIDTNWATIESVGGDTAITLSSAYTGAGTTGTYKIRRVYSVPSNERWSVATVADKFCFGNGDVNVQYWAGTGYAADLDSTDATKARYLIEYANRLFLGDLYVSGTRSAITLKWSKEDDPTDWTDSTAGELDLMDTEGPIMGLAKTVQDLIVFKQDNLYVYTRSGIATSPITLVGIRPGVGCVAPYSPVSFLGTCAWIGRDDFYRMDGNVPVPFGGAIRDKFFSEVGETEIKRVWGAVNYRLNEAMWIAMTSSGQYVFVYNYKFNEWYMYQFPVEVTAFGKGSV